MTHAIRAVLGKSGAVLSLVILCFTGCLKIVNEPALPPPPEVDVSQPLKKPVRLFSEFTGVSEAVRAIELRSRVRGFIQRIQFEPGASVRGPNDSDESAAAGELLYEIEADEYQAVLDAALAAENAARASVVAAEAGVQVAEAAQARASQDEKRLADLRGQNAVSATEYEKSVAALRSAEGELAAARAAVDLAVAQHEQAVAATTQAKLTLSYTKIHAPISGKITKTLFKEGDLIESGALLASIVDTSSIYVNFSISDREALRFYDQLRAGGADLGDRQKQWEEQPIFLARETDAAFPFQGQLNYVDQQGVDPTTGTLGLRAVFDNADGALLPGLFVRVRIPAQTAVVATLLPDRCIIRDTTSTYVLTVASDGKVQRKDITVNRRLDGWAIVGSELDDETWVVINGLQKAQASSRVQPLEVSLELDAAWIEP